MTRLALDGVTKVFGDPDAGGIVAVDDVSLVVDDGDFLVLLGPSGCGKTTTLRMIAGLETPTEGDVLFDDVRVNDVKARNRDIAMVFQDFALYPHMTVEENLGFGLRREDNDMSDAAIETRIEETATMLEIEELLGKKPASLSGGQKQRVALGRAIIREPRLFLFDEPLANLDASLRKTMRTEIDELQSQVGITSVYVTHNQEEAMTMGDYIAIMDEGALQQVGTPDQVFNEPANRFVAKFVGSPDMNLFEGTATDAGDDYRIEIGEIAFDMPKALVDREVAGTELSVGFRPQDLYQARRRGNEGPTVETDIRVVEPLGTEAVVHATTTEGDITAKVGDFHDLAAGDPVSFTVAPEHVYLFDADTGDLIKGRLMTQRADSDALEEAQA